MGGDSVSMAAASREDSGGVRPREHTVLAHLKTASWQERMSSGIDTGSSNRSGASDNCAQRADAASWQRAGRV